jgi:hypothetical protein
MKAIILAAAIALSGCVAYPAEVQVGFEPAVVVGLYSIGFYNPSFGYWNGYGWDMNFYVYGHPGYGHYYRGAPGYARGHYYASRGYYHHH